MSGRYEGNTESGAGENVERTLKGTATFVAGTPRGLRTDDPIVREALRLALAGAVLKLAKAGIGVNEEWGRIHHHPVNGRGVPVRGSFPDVLNMMVTPTLHEEGYGPIVHGTSYTQIVGFDESGPVADAVLLFGQSTDAASPHYYDQLEQLWSEYRWHRLPFRAGEIEAQMIRRVTIEE